MVQTADARSHRGDPPVFRGRPPQANAWRRPHEPRARATMILGAARESLIRVFKLFAPGPGLIRSSRCWWPYEGADGECVSRAPTIVIDLGVCRDARPGLERCRRVRHEARLASRPATCGRCS